ncbi:hypothetical protein PA10_00306 [Pseudomonas phage pPa_SNUABM_DT01]|nr:hypothetical protein PA10_00306 [Pseudomonas phage pPa_SNUABM_DT01]
MKSALMQDLLPTDARLAGKTLLASLENIELIDELAEQKARVVEDATTLAMRIGNDYPENPLVHQGMMQMLIGLAGDDVQVSQESGLLGALTKLSGFWSKPKPDPKYIPDEEKSDWSQRDKAIRQFLQEMEKTYLNQSWLGKQKFVEGTVPAKDFSGTFQIDGKPVTDPLANIEQHNKNLSAFIKTWEPQVKKLNDQVQAIHKRTVAATAGAAEDDEEAIAIVRKAVEEFNALPDPLDKFPTFNSTALGNQIPYVDDKHGWIQVKAKMEVTPSDTLPALDKEGIHKVALLVKEIMTNAKFFPRMEWLPWLDFKGGDRFSNWIYEADYSTYEDYYDRFYWQGARDCWQDGLEYLNPKHKVVTGLIKWMDRSIK